LPLSPAALALSQPAFTSSGRGDNRFCTR
jgi:hypothetical protein